MFEIIIFILTFCLSLSGVEIFRRWSLQRELLDIPNERSSHTIPTPRGGGVVIVLVCLIGYVIYSIYITGNVNWAYLSGAVLIAGISWFDDLHTISFYWRFLAHSVAAVLVIGFTGYFQTLAVPVAGKIELNAFGAAVTFLWIVWLTNAYNFMDGIDGIAGMQAVTAGLGWLIVGKLFDLETAGFYGGLIASASLGFLILNWQPAKIFMGDVGSAFLGYSFAVLPLLDRQAFTDFENKTGRGLLLVIAVLTVWFFVFDTLYTFIRRTLKMEKVWEAHRSHLYQRLVIAGFSHQAITGLYGILSVLTVAGTIFWMIETNAGGIVLLSITVLQTFGLLLFTRTQPGI